MRVSDLFILGFITAVVLLYNITSYRRRRRVERKIMLARKAVQTAVEILKAQGYRILDVERHCPVTVGVDDRQYRHMIVVDIIVKRQGKTYLVEVKSGKQTRRLNSARSRRQLLEYYSVYKPDGIILLEPDSGKMRYVSFRTAGGHHLQRAGRNWGFMVLGILLTWLYYHFRAR